MSRSTFPRNRAEREHMQAVPPASPTKAVISDRNLYHDLHLKPSNRLTQLLEQSDRLAYIQHLRETDHARARSSRQTNAYRYLNEVTTDPQEAVDRLLRRLQAKGAGMQLPDADWEQLGEAGGDLRSVDVLLDVAQLGELLQELFVYYRPGARTRYWTQSQRAKMEMQAIISAKMLSAGGLVRMEQPSILGKTQSSKMHLPSLGDAPIPSEMLPPLPPLPPALGVEEKDELLQELFLWSRANSLLFLQACYRDQPEKLVELLSGEGMEGKNLGVEEGKEGIGGMQGVGGLGGMGGGPVYVPVVELRKWLRAKGETIARVYADAN
ncbi:hypothetical protein B484DRAFT_399250 [Ochromonadaceae sp. CCMP2298]|nr:hypothetical protein B484DRAFT_399250 [Ochromonadaceae sp. CCMP2298]